MNPTSSITGITIPGAIALRIDTSFAGKVFTPIGGKPGVRTIQYLFGPGRTDPRPNVPNSAYLPSSKLPDKLVPGAYSLHIRNEGESHYTYIDIEVAAAPTTQPQKPTPPVVSTPTATPTGGGNVPAAIHKIQRGVCALLEGGFSTALPIHSGSGEWEGTITGLEAVKRLGVDRHREWAGAIPNWAKLKPWHDAGLATTICVAPNIWKAGNNPSLADTQSLAKQIVESIPAGQRAHVKRFELGNELLIGGYSWTHDAETLAPHVNALYDAFHAAGFECSTCGFNGDFAAGYDAAVAAGWKHDLIAVHMYCAHNADLQAKIARLNTRGKRVVETEFNAYDGQAYAAAAAKDKAAADQAAIAELDAQWSTRLKVNALDECHYYVSTVRNSPTGPKGFFAMAADGKSATTTVFYDWFAGLAK